MAELATIARPYAEALFQATAADSAQVIDQLSAVSAVTSDASLRQFADAPKAASMLVFNVVSDVLARQSVTLSPPVQNFLQSVLENGRLAALPEIVAQYKAQVNAQTGSSDAVVYSAYALDDAALADVVPALERRFARKLNARVVVDADLIGGIRVVVGDEVLDTSVKARLEQMKAALTA